MCKKRLRKPLFLRAPRPDRRNGGSPDKGIETIHMLFARTLGTGCRNGGSPDKGIETINHLPYFQAIRHVEMEVARTRALKHDIRNDIVVVEEGRNGGSPDKGIETLCIHSCIRQ